MREPSTLLLLLFRTAYLYILIIYAACMALGFNGALVGLIATTIVAVGSEVAFILNIREEMDREKELRYMV